VKDCITSSRLRKINSLLAKDRGIATPKEALKETFFFPDSGKFTIRPLGAAASSSRRRTARPKAHRYQQREARLRVNGACFSL
jgi:hypothetical protein